MKILYSPPCNYRRTALIKMPPNIWEYALNTTHIPAMREKNAMLRTSDNFLLNVCSISAWILLLCIGLPVFCHLRLGGDLA